MVCVVSHALVSASPKLKGGNTVTLRVEYLDIMALVVPLGLDALMRIRACKPRS
jgi:hypothetical protein